MLRESSGYDCGWHEHFAFPLDQPQGEHFPSWVPLFHLGARLGSAQDLNSPATIRLIAGFCAHGETHRIIQLEDCDSQGVVGFGGVVLDAVLITSPISSRYGQLGGLCWYIIFGLSWACSC
jgi:hypothetical protein